MGGQCLGCKGGVVIVMEGGEECWLEGDVLWVWVWVWIV